jgi:hypothetical protein
MDNKLEQIKDAVRKLFVNENENYIFIYTPPKVGSTTLVSSLRISLGRTYNIIHIHDEVMLGVLTGVTNVTINEIIHFLSNQQKNVYVIDVYRSPIERKMSEFFEKISPYHFNNTEDDIKNYNRSRIINRFNKLFPHLGKGDHYFEKYGINEPTAFDFNKQYSVQEIDKVKYVKLRLCDSNLWNNILSEILQTDIVIINDYSTDNKSIGELYKRIKQEYRLPCNFLDLIKNCPYFNFYYNEEERNRYIQDWSKKLSTDVVPYTENEYNFYVNLYLENQYINDIQTEHYIDNGCFCKFCIKIRKSIYFRAKKGETHFEKIVHTEVVNEEINSINKNINDKLLQAIKIKKSRGKYKPKQFAINTVNNNR